MVMGTALLAKESRQWKKKEKERNTLKYEL